MKIFQNKNKYKIGMTKEPFEPIDLSAIWKKVQAKKEAEKDEVTT